MAVIQRVMAQWRCNTEATQLRQRHAHSWRSRTLPVCWKEWRSRWMHARAALMVVARRTTKANSEVLVYAVRRWRVGSALRTWMGRREHVQRRRRLIQVMLTWQRHLQVSVWKQRAEEAASNLFWARGLPRLLHRCFAALRDLLLHLGRARATAMALAPRRRYARLRTFLASVVEEWLACTGVRCAVARMRCQVVSRVERRALGQRIACWRRNSCFAAKLRKVRMRVRRRVAAWSWRKWCMM